MARQITLFMRIHKTAGEALARQVCSGLPSETICPEAFEWKVRALPISDLHRYGFFQGHISPSALTAVFDSLRVFTMLRAPRQRLLSCFFYWKEGSKHAKGEFFETIAPMSLLDFLRSENPVIRRVTWNVQARLLAGGQFGGIDHQRQAVFGPWLPPSDLAGEAVRAMDRFALIGTAENYEQTLRKAYELLELGEVPAPERCNVTLAKPPNYHELLATPEVADALAQLIVADQVVYEEACNRLDRDQPDVRSNRILRMTAGP